MVCYYPEKFRKLLVLFECRLLGLVSVALFFSCYKLASFKWFSTFYGLAVMKSDRGSIVDCKLEEYVSFNAKYFSCISRMLSLLIISYLLICRLLLNENSNNLADSLLLKIYIGILGIYIVFQFFVALLLQVPAIRGRTQCCDDWSVIRFIKWMHQVLELCYISTCRFCFISIPNGLDSIVVFCHHRNIIMWDGAYTRAHRIT